MTKDEVTRIALECGFQLELPDGTMGLRPTSTLLQSG